MAENGIIVERRLSNLESGQTTMQAQLAKITDLLEQAVAAGTADRALLREKVARLEEQMRLARWMLGILATGCVGAIAGVIVQALGG